MPKHFFRNTASKKPPILGIEFGSLYFTRLRQINAEIRIQIIYYRLAVQDLGSKRRTQFKKKSGDFTFCNALCLVPRRLIIELNKRPTGSWFCVSGKTCSEPTKDDHSLFKRAITVNTYKRLFSLA